MINILKDMLNPVKVFKDDFGNIAMIEQTEHLPYKEAKKKTTCFRLHCMSEYNLYFLYHISCHETLEKALDKLSELSCGTFKEIEQKEG